MFSVKLLRGAVVTVRYWPGVGKGDKTENSESLQVLITAGSSIPPGIFFIFWFR